MREIIRERDKREREIMREIIRERERDKRERER